MPGLTAFCRTVSVAATTLDAWAITAISSGVLRIIMSPGTVPAPARDAEKRLPLHPKHPLGATTVAHHSSEQAEPSARYRLSAASQSHRGDHRSVARAVLRIDRI